MFAQVVPVIENSPWSPALIGALFVGIIGIITALGKVLVDLRQAKGKAVEAAQNAEVAVKAADEVKRTVEVSRIKGEEAGKARDGKLDEIKMLVDGKFSQVLDRVAKLTRVIADRTGKPGDIADANEAEIAAEKQRDKVLAASLGAGIDVDGTLTVTDGKASLEVNEPEKK